MKKYIFIFIAILFYSASCNAAILSVSSGVSQVEINKKISVDILLDTENESINSLEMTIEFPSKFMKFAGYDNKNNVIPFWVSPPQEKKLGNIYFSGVIPGGIDRVYDPEHPDREDIKIIRLFFEGDSVGAGAVSIKDAHLLKNDGLGSSVAVKTEMKIFTVVKDILRDNNESRLEEDTNPPSPFTISIIKNSFFDKTPTLAIFETQDQESGVEHFEVKIDNKDFVEAKSPYAIPYRLFPYTLSVKAFDFSGNFREETIKIGWDISHMAIWGLALVIFVLLYKYKLIKRKI